MRVQGPSSSYIPAHPNIPPKIKSQMKDELQTLSQDFYGKNKTDAKTQITNLQSQVEQLYQKGNLDYSTYNNFKNQLGAMTDAVKTNNQTEFSNAWGAMSDLLDQS